MKLTFEVSSPPSTGASTTIDLTGYSNYVPRFTGDLASYEPRVVNGAIGELSCCQGIRGNVDNDPADNIEYAGTS